MGMDYVLDALLESRPALREIFPPSLPDDGCTESTEPCAAPLEAICGILIPLLVEALDPKLIVPGRTWPF